MVLFLLTAFLLSANPTSVTVNVLSGEYWWIGITNQGHLMPIEDGYAADLTNFAYENQAQPVMVSSKGRYVWSEEPFKVSMEGSTLRLEKPSGEFIQGRAGTTLKEGYLAVSKRFFPPTGTMPDVSLFLQPQYNTWIELLYDQNQADILKYAHAIIDNGFPPGVIMIDDNWQEDYGVWKFRSERFPNPKAMVDELHAMGFKVMVWVCPFVSPDSQVYRELRDKDLLLKDESGRPKVIHWWNGQSAVLDLTHPGANEWFIKELKYLQETYGIDGFKLDAGDPEYYVDVRGHQDVSANTHSELFAKIGLEFPLNEYRATWKMGGQPLAQRLRDKGHSWSDLNFLIPHILTQGVSGYAFTCPDMIGGGLMGSFINLEKVDQELMVRSAQTHALMPMMQFSVAPWRVLNQENLQAVKDAIAIRAQFIPTIVDLAKHAAQTGEPIVRYMDYEYPGNGYERVSDQFLLGRDVLVAPILEAGSRSRQVRIPPGTWVDAKGGRVVGPRVVNRTAEINELIWFRKVR